jgi:uncharacterized protein
MSLLINLDQPTAVEAPSPTRRLDLPRVPTTRHLTRAAGESPTTSIRNVLISMAIGITLATLLGARGIVHAGKGMDDGPARTVTLSVGDAVLDVATALHVSWPWDRAEAALGRTSQPAVPPLLAMGPGFGNPASLAAVASNAPPQQGGLALLPARTATPSATPIRLATRTATATAHAGQVGSSRRGPSSGPTFYPRRPTSTASPTPHAPRHTPTTKPTMRPHTGPAHHVKKAAKTATPKPSKHRVSTSAGRSATAPPTPRATHTPIPQWRPLTASTPLRLLVTGDSLTGYLGPILINQAAAAGPVKGFVDTHNGTGLTRPDFVDWSLVAQQQIADDDPDAVVVMMGGNDFQNMTLPNGAFFEAGTPAWTKEYQRRAQICMRIWTQGGKRRVYWLSMPPARNTSWAYDDRQINIALKRAAARVPGAEYLNILGPVTIRGRYTDFVTENGQPVLIREQDGVHLNEAGSAIVANEVLAVLEREWRFGPKHH